MCVVLLLVAPCVLFVVCCLLFGAEGRALLAVCCSLLVVDCGLVCVAMCCASFAVRCNVLFASGWLLRVACVLLFAV